MAAKKGEKPPKKVTGRPLSKIDWPKAEKMANIHCTGEEIAAVLEISYDTLERAIRREYRISFADWYKRFSAGGKASLRRMQWTSAEEGNVTMQIWLGKQNLGQTDKVEQQIEADQSGKIDITFNEIKKEDDTD